MSYLTDVVVVVASGVVAVVIVVGLVEALLRFLGTGRGGRV